jgi:DNA-directed RNA polymerase specialized sigma24 family protein
MRGWLQDDIGKAIGLSESGVGHRLRTMRKKLSKQINN